LRGRRAVAARGGPEPTLNGVERVAFAVVALAIKRLADASAPNSSHVGDQAMRREQPTIGPE